MKISNKEPCPNKLKSLLPLMLNVKSYHKRQLEKKDYVKHQTHKAHNK